MADMSALENILRQSLELNLRYYSAVTNLAVSYYKDLATLLVDLRGSQAKPQAQPAPPPPPQAAQAVARPAQQAGVMVLEGEAGSQALGVFLIANNMAQEVSARVVASEFADAGARTIHPRFTFDPEVIVLAPSEQLLVRVITEIDPALEPGVRYSGEFAVPELPGTRIPIVIRRRPGVDAPVPERQATVEDTPKQSVPSAKSRSRKKKIAENESAKRE
jgi:hypothetical protein